MPDLIKFGDITVLAQGQGGHSFKLDSLGINLKPVQIARSDRAFLLKRVSIESPPTLDVPIRIYRSAVTDVMSVINSLYDGVERTLKVKGYPDIPNCVAVGRPQWTPKEKRVDPQNQPVDYVEVTVQFVQTKPASGGGLFG